MRPLKFLAGLALLPLCVAATRAVHDVARTLTGAEIIGVPAGLWWLLGGLAFWLFLFLATRNTAGNHTNRNLLQVGAGDAKAFCSHQGESVSRAAEKISF